MNDDAIVSSLTPNARSDGGVDIIVVGRDEIVNARNGELFEPDGAASTPRGRFDPVANDITLFRTADLSAFAHESGHAWLFQMVHDLEAAQDRAVREARADLRRCMGKTVSRCRRPTQGRNAGSIPLFSVVTFLPQ